MNDENETILTWQGWLDAFLRQVTLEGWTAFMQVAEDNQMPLWQWASMFQPVSQASLANAMLLACLQLPPAEARSALSSIALQVRAIHFEKAPRSMKRAPKELYRESSKSLLRELPTAAEFLQSVFLHYLDEDYDLQGDVNLLIREAYAFAELHERERMLGVLGRAGAAALRGCAVWSGWPDEGQPEFRHGMIVLISLLDGWQGIGLLPLGAIAAERTCAAERARQLSPERAASEGPKGQQVPSLPEVPLTEPFVNEWFELANHEEPLDDQQIRALGGRYDQFIEASIRALDISEQLPDDYPVDMVAELAAATLGVLRCSDPEAVNALITVVRDSGEVYSDDTIGAALWSLEQIGPAILPAVFDFVRYSCDDVARDDMLEVLGCAGRGSPAVYDYLIRHFAETSWDNGRQRYVGPLALLHDVRAVPLLASALSDPAADEDDIWELLDGLEELGVEFSVDRRLHSVAIPGYGTVAGVVPGDWLPRAERESLETDTTNPRAENEWESDEDEVVFDAAGIARCPDCGAVMRRMDGHWQHPAPDEPRPARPRAVWAQPIDRDDPCPCGSGRKYKHCHGRPGTPALN